MTGKSSPQGKPDGVPEAWVREKRPESYRVMEWRMLCLSRAGADDLTASALATTSHDLHVMERAIKAGLTMEQAAAIFL